MSKFKNSNLAFVIYTLVGAFLLVVLILIGVKVWLKNYTHHGAEVRVPDVCGMYVEEAQLYLKQQGLSLQVIDSTYSRKVPLGTIVEQNPVKDATTKSGRQIYVVMNARMERLVPLPELRDMSYRQAIASLHSLGMEVDDVEYQPSEFGGLVLDVKYRQRSVYAQTKLREGSKVTLVVGKSANNAETVFVPSLLGMTLDEARHELLRQALVVGAVNYDESDEADERNYVVYYQDPENSKWVSEGSRVTLYLSKDPNKTYQHTTDNDDEEFF